MPDIDDDEPCDDGRDDNAPHGVNDEREMNVDDNDDPAS